MGKEEMTTLSEDNPFSSENGTTIKTGVFVAMSVWKKDGDNLYLDRYATSCIVPGGMGKLLKAGQEWGRINNCAQIVTFADLEVSDGSLYERLGLKLIKY